jgi:hypothetical protein
MTPEHPAEAVVRQILLLHRPGAHPANNPEAAVTAQAAAVVTALLESGYLPPVEPPLTVEDVARWFADQTKHPRFLGIADGWRQLLESEGNVTMAYAQASKQHDAQKPLLREAAARLFDYHAHRRE